MSEIASKPRIAIAIKGEATTKLIITVNISILLC